MVWPIPVLWADIGKVARVEPTMGSAIVGEAFPVICVSGLSLIKRNSGRTENAQCGDGSRTPEILI